MPYIRPYESTVQPKPRPRMVRCLGITVKEHEFLSTDPPRIRVCPKCRAKLEQANYGAAVKESRDRRES